MPHSRQRATAIAALISVMLTAATRTDAQPGGAAVRPGVPTSAAYVVEVSAFTMTPANPKPGDNVSLQLTLRNRGTTNASNVPWLIGLQGGSQMVGQGTVSLAGGATQTVTATWRAVAGAQSALGTIAPPGANTMINTATVAQKAKDLTFNVASVSASTVSEMETRLIDWERARVNGARFTPGIQSGIRCNADVEHVASDPFTAYGYPGSIQIHGYRGAIAVYVNCSAVVNGMRANPELFGNFTLRNGWRVRSFDVRQIDPTQSKGAFGWSVLRRPDVNTDQPYAKLSMWADGGNKVLLVVVIQIEGPRGTNPYQ